MAREPLIMACCSDIAGLVRGKAFPLRDLEDRLATGVGWCPTNVQITAFNTIAETPFGPLGDALLMPDPDDPGRARVRPGRRGRALRAVRRHRDRRHALGLLPAHAAQERAGDARERDRSRPARELRARVPLQRRPAAWRRRFGLRSFRAAADFAERFAGALDQAGIAVELIQPEYGISQLEVSIAPRPGLEAADQAVILREVARAVARRQGSG